MEEKMATSPPRHDAPAGDTRADTELAALLTRADRLLGRRLSAILDRHGCTGDGWRVLCLLADGAGHPMTEVAGQVFLPPASLTKLVDHLVDDNLVYRRVDELDRRRIRTFLTPRGRRLHAQVQAEVAASLADLALPAAEQELLTGLLTRLVSALS
jgi:DNA-binding MarR family transcriptional regulator